MREKIYTTIYQIILMVGGLLTLKLLTNFLNKEQFGQYSLVLSILALIAILPYNSISQAVIRYHSIFIKRGKLGELLYSTYSIYFIVSIVYLFSFICILILSDLNKHLVVTIYLLVTSEVLKTLLRGVVNAERLRKRVSISAFNEFFLKISLIFLIHLFFDLNVILVITTFVIANLFSIIPLLFDSTTTLVKPQKIVEKNINKRIFWFSFPLVIWGFFGWARDMSNRWFLEWFVSTDSVAIFSVLTSISMIIPTVIQSLLNSYYIPILYQEENDKPGTTRIFMNKLMVYYLIGLVPFFLILNLVDEEIILLLSSIKYVEYAWLLPWMVTVYALYVLSSLVAIEVFSAKRTYYLLAPNILPGIISMVVGYFLIARLGLKGAFLSYAITYSSYAILMLITIYIFRRGSLQNER